MVWALSRSHRQPRPWSNYRSFKKKTTGLKFFWCHTQVLEYKIYMFFKPSIVTKIQKKCCQTLELGLTFYWIIYLTPLCHFTLLQLAKCKAYNLHLIICKLQGMNCRVEYVYLWHKNKLFFFLILPCEKSLYLLRLIIKASKMVTRQALTNDIKVFTVKI